MGFDDDGVGGGVSGDNGLGRLAKAAGEATLVDEGPDVASSEGASSKRLLHGVGDIGFTVENDETLKFLQLVF